MVNKFTARALFLVSLFCLLVGGGKAYAGTLGTLVDFSTLNNYSPNGAAWKSNFTIDWDTQYLEIVIDATNCTDADNIFTLTAEKVPAGNRVDWWGTYEGSKTSDSDLLTKPARVHAYYKSSYINFYRFLKDNDLKTNPTATGVTSSNKSYIVFKVSKADGLQATIGTDGTAQTVCSASDLTDDFFAADMTIGSEEGSTRMHGTYSSVAIKNIGGTPVPPTPTDAVIINSTTGVTGYKKVIKENYTTPTSSWSLPVTIDWDKENLVVNADISGLSSSKKGGLFAVAPEGTTLGWNTNSSIHYKETGANTVRGYVPSSGTDGDNNYGDKAFSNGKAQFVYSKDKGLSFYNLTSGTVISVESKQLAAYSAITSASNIKVGLESEYNRVSIPLSIYVQSIDYSEGSSSTSNLIKESAVNTFSDQTNVKVGLERTLQSDKWNTFCVPFDVPAEMLSTTFGTDVEIRTLGSVEGYVINFTGATSIEAGKPYLIKPLVNVENPVFNGVDIKSAEPTYMGNAEYGMQGTYGLKVLATDGSELFLGADNEFLAPEAGKETMKGMRCFFKAPAGTDPASLRANIDGVETAIDAIDATETVADTTVYNLQGQRVGNTLQGLPRGLYIQNGKKVVVK